MNGMQRNGAVILVGLAVVVAHRHRLPDLLVRRRREASPSPSASESVAPSASSSLNAELLDRRWTVLYVGTDLNATREAEGTAPNTDALMLASLSADQSQLTLISLPRDTVDVPLADGGTWPEKINSLYVQRGIDELVGAMETLYGVPIDAYLVLDMDDFAAAGGCGGWHRGVAAGADGGPEGEPGSAGRRPGARCTADTRLRPHPGRPGLRAHGPPAGGLGRTGRASSSTRRPTSTCATCSTPSSRSRRICPSTTCRPCSSSRGAPAMPRCTTCSSSRRSSRSKATVATAEATSSRRTSKRIRAEVQGLIGE